MWLLDLFTCPAANYCLCHVVTGFVNMSSSKLLFMPCGYWICSHVQQEITVCAMWLLDLFTCPAANYCLCHVVNGFVNMSNRKLLFMPCGYWICSHVQQEITVYAMWLLDLFTCPTGNYCLCHVVTGFVHTFRRNLLFHLQQPPEPSSVTLQIEVGSCSRTLEYMHCTTQSKNPQHNPLGMTASESYRYKCSTMHSTSYFIWHLWNQSIAEYHNFLGITIYLICISVYLAIALTDLTI